MEKKSYCLKTRIHHNYLPDSSHHHIIDLTTTTPLSPHSRNISIHRPSLPQSMPLPSLDVSLENKISDNAIDLGAIVHVFNITLFLLTILVLYYSLSLALFQKLRKVRQTQAR